MPKEFSHFRVGATRVVAHTSCVDWTREVLRTGTLYEWASRHPERRELPGRVPAFSVPMPNDGRRVVVRHGHHGGLLGPLLKDVFLPPTRAPYELLVSYVLASAGVRTPPVAAFAIYQTGWLFRRSDFVTLELTGHDLGDALMTPAAAPARGSWLASLGELMQALTRAGAWHPDLNVRNIFLVPDATGVDRAFVLDVDRVRFAPPGDPNVQAANLARLERSVRKMREQNGAGFDDDELRQLRSLAAMPSRA